LLPAAEGPIERVARALAFQNGDVLGRLRRAREPPEGGVGVFSVHRDGRFAL
jgi:hypothetical protein